MRTLQLVPSSLYTRRPAQTYASGLATSHTPSPHPDRAVPLPGQPAEHSTLAKDAAARRDKEQTFLSHVVAVSTPEG